MSISFLQAASDGNNQSTYTFSSQNLGTPSTGRYIIVGTFGSGGSTNVLSVSVAGITATELTQTGAASPVTGLFIAAVPTGTSGDIIINFNGSKSRAMYGAWEVTDLSSITPTSTDNEQDTGGSSGSLTTTATVNDNGVIVSVYYAGAGGGDTVAWTNLDEDFDEVGESSTQYSGASTEFATGVVDRDITASLGSNTLQAMSTVSLQFDVEPTKSFSQAVVIV